MTNSGSLRTGFGSGDKHSIHLEISECAKILANSIQLLILFLRKDFQMSFGYGYHEFQNNNTFNNCVYHCCNNPTYKRKKCNICAFIGMEADSDLLCPSCEMAKHQSALIQNPHSCSSWLSTSMPASSDTPACSTRCMISRIGQMDNMENSLLHFSKAVTICSAYDMVLDLLFMT